MTCVRFMGAAVLCALSTVAQAKSVDKLRCLDLMGYDVTTQPVVLGMVQGFNAAGQEVLQEKVDAEVLHSRAVAAVEICKTNPEISLREALVKGQFSAKKIDPDKVDLTGMKCADAVRPEYRPVAAAWALAYNKKGRLEAGEIDEELVRTATDRVVEACVKAGPNALVHKAVK